jgi:hypothetical protein
MALTNMECARKTIGNQCFGPGADTELSREEWVATAASNLGPAAINMKKSCDTTSGGQAATCYPAPSTVIYSFESLDQDLLGATSPPASVINLGRDKNNVHRGAFRVLVMEELRLLAVKMNSSPNMTVLNLSGNNGKFSNCQISEVAEALERLTALQELDLSVHATSSPFHFFESDEEKHKMETEEQRICAEWAGMLAKALGKLTALKKLNLACTGLFSEFDGVVVWERAMHGVAVGFIYEF